MSSPWGCSPPCLSVCWGLGFPGAGEKGGGEEQHQEKVGVEWGHSTPSSEVPDSLTFCRLLSPLLCHSSLMQGVSAVPFPQEITGPGW